MGLFDRLTRLIRSNLNDLIARAENPEKMLTQIIEDMRRQLAQAKQEVAVAIADERKLRAQVEEEHRQAVDWEKRARLAVREERDDLAKQALLRAQEHANHAQELQTQWERHREDTERLKDSNPNRSAKAPAPGRAGCKLDAIVTVDKTRLPQRPNQYRLYNSR